MAGNLDRKLRLPSIHFRVLLHAANMRYGTNGFTSLAKEGVLRIFSPWKLKRLRLGLNPRIWIPKASTLHLEPRSRYLVLDAVKYIQLDKSEIYHKTSGVYQIDACNFNNFAYKFQQAIILVLYKQQISKHIGTSQIKTYRYVSVAPTRHSAIDIKMSCYSNVLKYTRYQIFCLLKALYVCSVIPFYLSPQIKITAGINRMVCRWVTEFRGWGVQWQQQDGYSNVHRTPPIFYLIFFQTNSSFVQSQFWIINKTKVVS